jgi:Helix-turn-helix domain
MKQPVAQVRGVLAERVIISTPLDPLLSIKALAAYASISPRKLREYLDDPANPLPCYRPGGKILVRVSEFDAWIATYRQQGCPDVARIVEEVLGDGHPRRRA